MKVIENNLHVVEGSLVLTQILVSLNGVCQSKDESGKRHHSLRHECESLLDKLV